MVPLASLLIPIILAALLVFFASSIIHMLLPYHRTDYTGIPDEAAVAAALRNVPPGDYALPYAGSPAAMKDPVFQEKMKTGPIAFMTVARPGGNWMTTSLVWWFVYCLVVSIFAAYVAARAEGPGAEYFSVFRFASVTAYLGYGMATWHNTIWYKQKVSTVVKNNIDALIYALLTGGAFAGFWPS